MGDPVPLREFVEALTAQHFARLQERWEAHQEVHEREAEVRAEIAKRNDYRLAQLNALRSEVLTDRERLITREIFETRSRFVDDKIDDLSKHIDRWQGQQQGLSMSGTLLVGAVGLIATILAIYFALT